MSDKPEPLSAILAEARNKYTVHDCNECDYRKSCDLPFDCDECKTKRKSISLAFGIEDNYFTKLLDRIEAAVQRFVADDCAKCAHRNAATISLKDALDLANAIANNGINANDLGDKASATIYALCHEVRTVRGEDANIKQEVQKLRRELRELRRATGNAVYAEVEVQPARGGGGNQRREGAGA